MRRSMADLDFFKSLNESPSEKEGKFASMPPRQ